MESISGSVSLKSSEEASKMTLEEAISTHIGASIPYGALSSVPLGICALGQLMLTASIMADKSINNPPIGGFKYIKYPESLRTTLMQISNWGYEALNTGHQGMAMIHGYSKQIKTAAMEAARTMQKATPENQASVEKIVEYRLENIRVATENCQKESDKVITALEKLLELIEETSEACSNSMKAGVSRLKENQNKEKELQEKKKAAEIEKQKLETEKKEYEKHLKLTQEELHSALGAVPEGLALLGFEALDIIRSLFSNSKSGALKLSIVRMEIAKQANLEAERKIERGREEMKASDRDFMDAVVQLSQLDLNKVSYKDALKLLQQAVEFITQLLTHWRKLQEFCQSLNNFIQLQLTDGSKKLEKEIQLQLTLSEDERFLMSDDILNSQLRTMVNKSYQIGCIGELYVRISTLYIMPAIGALSENSAVDEKRIEHVRNELTSNATKAHESIVKTIEAEKKCLLDKVVTQNENINHLLTISNNNYDLY